MSRGVFRSHNKPNEVFTFNTVISSADTITPLVSFDSGSDRVHWDFGDGSLIEAGNNPSHTYSDGGTLKTIKMTTNDMDRLETFTCGDCYIKGELDMSDWTNLSTTFSLTHSFTKDNTHLTGITHTYSPNTITSYSIIRNNVTGNLDLTMFPGLGGSFYTWSNPNLTSVTHTASTQTFTQYRVDLCDITGVHDMSMLTNMSGIIRLNSNNITNVLHAGNNNVFTQYHIDNNDLTGNLDLTMFPGLGGSFRAYVNPNLTGITHTASSQTFTSYLVNICDITGTYDLTMFPGLGGSFNMSSNSNLTEILHTASTNNFTQYTLNSCNITGIHDLSMLSGLGGTFNLYSNSGLSGVTFTASSNTFSSMVIHNCDLQGTLDLSMFPGLGGLVQLQSNGNLTDITFPYTTETFANNLNLVNNYAFSLNNCDLGYVDFLPLSGITMDVNYVNGASIDLSTNGMTATEVNHHLVDFDNMASNLNPNGWSGVTLYIDGSNAAPDSSSGGFDGVAAISSLTGSPNNWIITTS